MDAQSTRLAAVANNIANSDTAGYRRQTTSLSTLSPAGGVQASVREDASASNGSDPLSDMTEMIESEDSFALNADAFETGADMWQMLATIKRD